MPLRTASNDSMGACSGDNGFFVSRKIGLIHARANVRGDTRLVEDTLMFGGITLIESWLEADPEAPWRLPPGCFPDEIVSPRAAGDEDEEEDEEEDEDDEEDDEELDDDLDEDFDEDFDDEDLEDDDFDDLDDEDFEDLDEDDLDEDEEDEDEKEDEKERDGDKGDV